MSETTPRPTDSDRIYDLVGVGFGPANLSLAVALEEEAERSGGADLDRLFLEARTSPCWHPGMLIEDSMLQITVLKDLVTVRNPCSRFTFLNYLKEKDRLFEFLNLRDLFPTRIEFNDYLTWATEKLSDRVRFGRRVRSIEPIEEGADGSVRLVRVTAERVGGPEAGSIETLLARNVVVATGPTKWLPAGVELPRDEPMADRVFHAYDFMHRMDRGFPDRQGSPRLLVIGSGQSGAELFFTLLRRYPNADITAAVRRFGYKPVDESDYTNEVFFPSMIDFFYDLPDDRRQRVVDSFRDVNYAVVDHPLIRKIYRALYDERVAGKDRARLLRYVELEAIETEGETVHARFRHLIEDRPVELELDGVVVATGFRWDKEHPLLDGLSHCFATGADGYKVRRDYRLEGQPGFEAGVYLQGYLEATHGISETVLSLLPMRAQDIVDSLVAACAATPPAASTVPEAPEVGVV